MNIKCLRNYMNSHNSTLTLCLYYMNNMHMYMYHQSICISKLIFVTFATLQFQTIRHHLPDRPHIPNSGLVVAGAPCRTPYPTPSTGRRWRPDPWRQQPGTQTALPGMPCWCELQLSADKPRTGRYDTPRWRALFSVMRNGRVHATIFAVKVDIMQIFTWRWSLCTEWIDCLIWK